MSNHIAEDMHTGATAIGLSIAAAMVVGQQARAGARQEIREIAHGTIARWQGYAAQLKAALTLSKRREDQLARDLADAMSVIGTLEREVLALRRARARH